MQRLDPQQVVQLVTKAFVLEAITDKPGCTTRYQDLEGKPLQDFIIAGINSAYCFGKLAEDIYANSGKPIFSHNLEALQASNVHKSTKYINFGLLEIMFPVVAARLMCDQPSEVIKEAIRVVKSTTNKDVESILSTRKLAWATSQKQKHNFDYQKYQTAKSVWDFYEQINQDYDSNSSHYNWTEQFKLGLPILNQFFEAYSHNVEVMTTTGEIFESVKKQNPNVALGIVADMCAAAIFLWLSFNQGVV